MHCALSAWHSFFIRVLPERKRDTDWCILHRKCFTVQRLLVHRLSHYDNKMVFFENFSYNFLAGFSDRKEPFGVLCRSAVSIKWDINMIHNTRKEKGLICFQALSRFFAKKAFLTRNLTSMDSEMDQILKGYFDFFTKTAIWTKNDCKLPQNGLKICIIWSQNGAKMISKRTRNSLVKVTI